jgi:hypothetical protein
MIVEVFSDDILMVDETDVHLLVEIAAPAFHNDPSGDQKVVSLDLLPLLEEDRRLAALVGLEMLDDNIEDQGTDELPEVVGLEE